MSRDEAIARLRKCAQCKRWITTVDCDHCWVDNHRCPPAPQAAVAALNRAIEIGREAEALKRTLATLH